MEYRSEYNSPVGKLILLADENALKGLWIENQKYFEEGVEGKALPGKDSPVIKQAEQWLNRYFAGGKPTPDELPLHPEGSGFRQKVWKLLCEIPLGETTTYGALAQKIAAELGKTRFSAQAVGGAVGHNPISIIIPCHRVVGTSGSLTGYAGGIEKKRWLLEHEGVDMSRLY